MTTRLLRRPRLARTTAALALVLPLSVAALSAPASASTVLADSWSAYPSTGYGYGYGYGVPSYGGPRGYGGYGYAPSTTTSTDALAGLDTSDASTTQSAGLVEITSTVDYDAGEAMGTGIILSSDGLVVTNHHVVEGATSIQVTDVATGATYTADVLGYNAKKDVALLQLQDASGLTPVTTDASGVAVGTAVTSVGDANGDGGSLTAAPGTVSDRRTSITVSDEQTGAKTRLRRLIEVTSDIVPGDSGGALLDSDGEVVGMNVAASSGTTSATVDGYVIPISRVLRIVDKIESGDAGGATVVGSTGFLGVELSNTSTAALVAGTVADSPAEALGLVAGDTITAIDGTRVTTAAGLSKLISTHAAGDSVTVTWTGTGGATHSGTATLIAGPVG